MDLTQVLFRLEMRIKTSTLSRLVIACITIIFFEQHKLLGQSQQELDSLKTIVNSSEGIEQLEALIVLSNLQNQSNPTDALETAKQAEKLAIVLKSEISRGNALDAKANALSMLGDHTKAIELLNESVKIGKQENDQLLIAETHQSLGIIYERIGNYPEALANHKSSLLAFTDLQDSTNMSYSLNNIAGIYYSNDDYETALDYYYKAQVIKNALNDPFGIGSGYSNLAVVYKKLENYKKSIEYHHKAIPLQKEINDLFGLSIAYSNMGTTFRNLEQYDSSLYFQDKALELSTELKDTIGIAIAIHNKANVFFSLKDYKKAENFYSEAFSLFEKTGIKAYELASLSDQASMFKEAGQNSKAYNIATQALSLAQQLNSKARIRNLAEVLYLLSKNNGAYRDALKYHELYKEYTDSIITAKKVEEIGKLEINHEINERDNEIKTLAQAGEITSLKLEKTQATRTFLIILVSLLLLISIILWSNYRLKRKSEKVLGEKNEELKKLNSAKDQFFAIISHDLKNPLSAFRMITEAIHENIETLSKDEIQSHMKELMKSSNQLHLLLKNLLQWALVQTERVNYKPKNHSVEYLIEHNVRLFEQMIKIKDLQVVVDIEEGLKTYCDKGSIDLIIRNLLSNAIKFTSTNGSVCISAIRKDSHVNISIEDSGIGMSEAEIQKLFKIEEDPSQIGNSREKGTGLGLMLSSEFVRKNKGTISVESEPGKGAKFTIILLPAA